MRDSILVWLIKLFIFVAILCYFMTMIYIGKVTKGRQNNSATGIHTCRSIALTRTLSQLHVHACRPELASTESHCKNMTHVYMPVHIYKYEHAKYKLSIRIVFTESTSFIPKLDVRCKIGICERNNDILMLCHTSSC